MHVFQIPRLKRIISQLSKLVLPVLHTLLTGKRKHRQLQVQDESCVYLTSRYGYLCHFEAGSPLDKRVESEP